MRTRTALATAAIIALCLIAFITYSWGTVIHARHLGECRWIDLPADILAEKDSVKVPDFCNAVGDISQYCFASNQEMQLAFRAKFHHGWVDGSPIKTGVRTYPIDTGFGSVVLGMDYAIIPKGGIIPSSQTSLTKTIAVGPVGKMLPCPFGEIDTTGIPHGSEIIGRVYRDTNNPSDTYNGSIMITNIAVRLLVDDYGSFESTP